jgi:hypothetical protein
LPPQKESSLTPAQPDFYVRRAIKGTPHLFQVYFTPTQAWFIRVGGTGAGEIVAAANGGLIGALFVWFLQSRRQKKETQTIAEHSAKTLEQMLAGHKVNQVIPLSNIADPSLEAGNWTVKKGTVIWKFNLPGEKKRVECYFHKDEDLSAGMNRLPRLFPGIRIEVALDERKGKYLKKV